MAVDEASFNTSIDSIKSAEISFNEPLTPSIRTKGSLLWLMDPPPRTRIETVASGRPSCVVTFTPDNFPCKACAAFATGIAAICFPETDATEPVRSLRFTV